MNLTFEHGFDSINIHYKGVLLFHHAENNPALFIGKGYEKINMERGSFEIKDNLEERIAIRRMTIMQADNAACVKLTIICNNKPQLIIDIIEQASGVKFALQSLSQDYNRLWWRLPATPCEHIWGLGEQMSYFDLRGRSFPLWTSESGVGRDKSTYLTWQADVEGRGGGDYYQTYYPQPTFISSQHYCCHADTTAYADFDFRDPNFHELGFWAIPNSIEFIYDNSFVGLVTKISTFFGRQPPLPDWLHSGVMLGLKGGRQHAENVLAKSKQFDLKVSALWCEDWVGIRQTSFGKRLFWDWKWQSERYPALDIWIKELAQQNIRFLGYVNPYLCADGSLYQEALALDYLVKGIAGGVHLVDFGEFYCGIVDFTNPMAMEWFALRIIGKEMLEFGLAGWMADFGEYLPINISLFNGGKPQLLHNAWPVLWAEVNAAAIEKYGKTGEVIFFMRAGYSGIQKFCPLLWAGDQSVDFSRHDGLPSVICAALSSGLLGNAYHHSDIGGYTSLFGNVRTPELFMRWTEMAVFSALMRTHEGNRPDSNFQFYQDDDVLRHFARMTLLHVKLTPYIMTLIDDAVSAGLPLQRPLFLHYEDDKNTYMIQDQYLFGRDILVAPVHKADYTAWNLYLPQGDDWVHIWTRETFTGGQQINIIAPIGTPPVFIRQMSKWRDYILEIANCD